MTKGKELTIGGLKEKETQPFVTGGVLRGMIVLAGFTTAIRPFPGRCRFSSFRGCLLRYPKVSTKVMSPLKVRYSTTLPSDRNIIRT